jgi:hypothetical protein
VSTPRTRKRRNTGGFGFLSRAQLLEAKAKRLSRELQSWAEAGGDIEDTKTLEQHTVLVNEIYALEPQVRIENEKIYPAVVAFDIARETEDEKLVTVSCVAIGTALFAQLEDGTAAAKWFVAPHFTDQEDNGFTWSELVRYMSAEGLASLEVLR